jgi:subtilisin family serine protease
VTVAGNYLEGGGQCLANHDSDIYPAVLGSSVDGLIAVAGIDETNHVWVDSCRGPAIDILAPATNMLVASISGHDHYRSSKGVVAANTGTSYSAPFVSGIAALLLERNPAYTPPQLEAIIKATSTRTADPAETTGGGMVAGFDAISSRPRHRAVAH